MLSRILEWHRIVNVSPSNETIDRRKGAIQNLVKALDDAKDLDLLLSLASGIVAGFETSQAQYPTAITQLVSICN